MIDWDNAFATAHLSSMASESLCIQNRNPCASNATARNIFKEDKKEILAMAAKHEYVMLGTDKDAVVSFVRRPNKRGALWPPRKTMNAPDPKEWDFDVPASEVDIDKIHQECLEVDVFSRATYVLALEKNAPITFARYRDKYLGGADRWGR